MSAPKLTAKTFLDRLKSHASEVERKKYQRYFKFTDEKPLKDDEFIGVRMGQVFELAKEFIVMSLPEIEKLMENQIHEARAGAMSIMGKRAASKKTTEAELKGLYDLYLRRHDRVNDWDLVDLASYHVVGRYLADKPRKVLYKLARSKNKWERRTAIVSTAHFIRQKDVEDAFKIAELLVDDKEETVQKGAGWMLRFAGDVDRKRLLQFLDEYAATMPRIMLRNSIEKLNPKVRSRYLAMKPTGKDMKPTKTTASSKVKEPVKKAVKPVARKSSKAIVSVEEFLAALDHPLTSEIDAVRKIIKGVNRGIAEEIKWSAPSFNYGGEYLVTFHLRSTDKIHLIFHHPKIAKVKNSILEGDYKDRRMSYFADMKAIRAKKGELQSVISELIAITDADAA